ncbi:MAG: DNA translocase FtsK 4TM domain-containing protein, partial [Stellaceae bacterium]
MRSWTEMVAGARKRLCEGAGASLVLVSLLLVLALLTYSSRDPSFDTATDGPATNFLGHDGAYVADLLVQSLGLAAYLIPVVLLGWAFRLLLQRPPRRFGRRLMLLAPALILGAFACSILRVTSLPLPAGAGGAIGGALSHMLAQAGFASAELPSTMVAAALVAALLLSVMGLSPSDWRELGNGAGRGAARFAVVSGRGTLAAAALGARWWRQRREMRR